MAWPEHRLGLEADGVAWHGDPVALHTDRVRQNALAVLGWSALRATWADTYEPELLVDRGAAGPGRRLARPPSVTETGCQAPCAPAFVTLGEVDGAGGGQSRDSRAVAYASTARDCTRRATGVPSRATADASREYDRIASHVRAPSACTTNDSSPLSGCPARVP